jgi:hypothetical protein
MGDWVNLKTDTHAKGERYSSFKCQCGGTAKVKAVLTGENRVLFSNLAGVHVLNSSVTDVLDHLLKNCKGTFVN